MRSDDYIIRLRANNADLKKKLAESKAKLASYNKAVSMISNSVGAAFATMFAVGGIAAGFSKVVTTLVDFEFQMSKVGAVSRASSAEMDKLTSNALQLGAKSQYTAVQIGKLQEELARLGFGTDQIINMTDAIRKLATVADEELGLTAQAVGKTLNAFNLEATESGRVANVMAESFAKTALNLEEFSVGMSYAATAGKSAGFSLEQVTAMLGALVDSGLQGSKAGTALRDIFADLSIKGMTLEDALSEIRSASDKNAKSFELFGKVSMNAAVILAEQSEKVDNLNTEFSDTNTELDKMTSVMEDNLLTDWKLFTSAIDGAILKNKELNNDLRDVVQGLTTMVTALGNAYKYLKLIADVRPGGGDEWEKFFNDIFNPKTPTEDGLVGPVNEFLSVIDKLSKKADEIKKLRPDFSELDAARNKQYADSISEINKELETLRNNLFVLDSSELGAAYDEMQQKQMDFYRMLNDISAMVDEGINLFGVDDEKLAEDADKVAQGYREGREKIQAEIDMLNDILNNTLSSMLGNFFEVLGATGGNFDKAFASMLNGISAGLSQFGDLLIAQGIAIEAFKKSLASLSGPVAIAAGVALKLAAGAVAKHASNMSRGQFGGGSLGGGTSGRSALVGQTSPVNIPDKIYLTAKGRDLEAVMEANKRSTNRTG